MPTPYTTISQGASHVLRLVQQPYATTLQHYSDRGCDQVALDADELQAVLRALPRAVVLAALGLAPAGQGALAGDAACIDCGVCLVCQRPGCAAGWHPEGAHVTPGEPEGAALPLALDVMASTRIGGRASCPVELS